MASGKYQVLVTEQADKDILNLYQFIVSQHTTSHAAKKYVTGLKEKINSLANDADIYEIKTNESLSQYGINVRRINYKKMTAIYTIHHNTVYIHRVIPASMIL